MLSSESDNLFPRQFSFTDSFETQGSYMYDCSFVKYGNYSSSEVSLSSVLLFSSSEEALFINSDFNIFMMKLFLSSKFVLQVQSYKLYNNKYAMASTQVTNTEIFAVTAVLVLKLLSRKVLFINRKDN